MARRAVSNVARMRKAFLQVHYQIHYLALSLLFPNTLILICCFISSIYSLNQYIAFQITIFIT